MLLNTYGHGDGEVDVRRLLIDAGTSVEFQHMIFILLFVFPIPGVWHDGPTSRDIVSPDRRRQAHEDFLGTGDLRYPYSPDRSPDRTFGDDRLGTGLLGGTCLTAFLNPVLLYALINLKSSLC